MIITCKYITETDEETIYDAYLGKNKLGTMSHRKGTGIWLVRDVTKKRWHTCDLLECCRVVFFPKSTEEILFVDPEGRTMHFPTED